MKRFLGSNLDSNLGSLTNNVKLQSCELTSISTPAKYIHGCYVNIQLIPISFYNLNIESNIQFELDARTRTPLLHDGIRFKDIESSIGYPPNHRKMDKSMLIDRHSRKTTHPTTKSHLSDPKSTDSVKKLPNRPIVHT